jgi:hemerythrin-like domain-containing protein
MAARHATVGAKPALPHDSAQIVRRQAQSVCLHEPPTVHTALYVRSDAGTELDGHSSRKKDSMNALQSLAAEHRVIRLTLDAFEIYVGYIEARAPVNRADLERFVAFFEEFADLHHHDKEETLLFPALAREGLDWNGEPLARVRREHDQEHYLMRSLRHLVQQAETWSEEDRQHFLSIAKTFIAFQLNHMRFENMEVYPAATLLSEVSRARLSRDLQRYDEAARASKERLTELAEILMRRYLLNDRSPCQGTNRVDRNSAGPR